MKENKIAQLGKLENDALENGNTVPTKGLAPLSPSPTNESLLTWKKIT